MGRWATYRILRSLAKSSSSSSCSSYSSSSIPFLKPLFLSSKPYSFSSYSSYPSSQFRRFRPLCSAPSSSAAALAVDFDSGSRYFGENYADEVHSDEDLDLGVKVPVKAFFLSTSINLDGLNAENKGNVVKPTSTSRTLNYTTLGFGNASSEPNGMRLLNNVSCNRYMVVFQYGSVVLFNVEDHDVSFFLSIASRHASGLLKESEMRKDDYIVKENPTLAEDMVGGADYIVLKHLDIDSIRIVGSVLGQSIALDYSVSQVDTMVEEFAAINRKMEKSGEFDMNRKKLFKLVGKANSNLADIILKVGLFDRSEIAWRDAKYAQINEYLREEYEVAQRFGNLDIKLKFVEHNIHFLQEVLQNRKSDLLEWCIIILLSIENVISVYEIIRESTGGSV